MPKPPSKKPGIIAIDTECTGLDLHHAARPFLFTSCTPDGVNIFYEWDVDPLTRKVIIPKEDLAQVKSLVHCADKIIMHNSKFDVTALRSIGIKNWPWYKTVDTIYMAHLLGSNRPKDLTSLGIVWLGVNIQEYEDELEVAVKECQRYVRSQLKEWKTARVGDPGMPSVKEKSWKYDMWLPRALAKHLDHPKDHPWWTVTQEYANADSGITILLYQKMMAEIERRGLTKIHEFRQKLPEIFSVMESNGVTISNKRTVELLTRLGQEKQGNRAKCIQLSGGGLEELPVNGMSNALRDTLTGTLGLKSPKVTEKGNPSYDKGVLDTWLAELNPRSKQFKFVHNLRMYRKRSTAIAYLESYRKFWLPTEYKDTCLLHPSLNGTGTDTLRCSSQNPNEQNISKQETECPVCKGDQEEMRGCLTCRGTGLELRSLRWAFGPPQGYEWWSMDANNIELRLPAYYSQQQELIDLFERPNEPPYYGSTHLLNFHTVYEDIWEKELAEVGLEKVGPHCKKKYASSWYQWVKNGGFGVQYGAVERTDKPGTADIAFRRFGSHAKLKARFNKLEELNQACIEHARTYGYVETIPDKDVDPTKGYPLLCTRSWNGDILPTVPLNYKIQGSAMWWMCRAMMRCQEYLLELNHGDPHGEHRIVMQVHDELVFQLPASYDSTAEGNAKYGNLSIVNELRHRMELSGVAFGIPTPVSSEYHSNNWATGITVKP